MSDEFLVFGKPGELALGSARAKDSEKRMKFIFLNYF
jgi:hypothetical protein